MLQFVFDLHTAGFSVLHDRLVEPACWMHLSKINELLQVVLRVSPGKQRDVKGMGSIVPQPADVLGIQSAAAFGQCDKGGWVHEPVFIGNGVRNVVGLFIINIDRKLPGILVKTLAADILRYHGFGKIHHAEGLEITVGFRIT